MIYYKEMLFKDLGNCSPTYLNNKKENCSPVSGNVRLSFGMYRTPSEENVYRQKSLRKKLP